MDFSFNDDQTAVRELAGKLLSEPLALRDGWRALGQAQLLGVGLPAAVGGSDLGFVALCLLLEQAGEHASPLPFIPSLVLAGLPIARARALHWLSGLCAGERILCGSFGQRGQPALRGRRVRGGWSVSGAETYVVGLPDSDLLLLAATSESASQLLFVVGPLTEGLRIEPQQSASGVSVGRLQLQDVEVSGEALLCEPDRADALIEWTLERAFLAQSAYELGLSARALALTARFASEREQFGRPIGTFQAVAQRLADAHIAVESMRLTLWRAAWLVEQGADASHEIAIARSLSSRLGHEVVAAAQHIHGSTGFDRDYPLHRYFLASKHNEQLLGGPGFHLARLGRLLAR